MAICFLEKGSFSFFFSLPFFFGGRGLGGFEFFQFIAELHNACMRTPMTRHDGDKHPARTGMCLHTLGLLHAYPEIFENGHFLKVNLSKNNAFTRSVLESFSPVHSKTVKQWYDIWRHISVVFKNLHFHPSTQKKTSRRFKKTSSWDPFRKLAFLVSENIVYVRREG